MEQPTTTDYAGERCPWCEALWGVGKIGKCHQASNAELWGLRCPWSVPCPICPAGVGQWCWRPSEHPVSKTHAARMKVYLAETEATDELLEAWKSDRREPLQKGSK